MSIEALDWVINLVTQRVHATVANVYTPGPVSGSVRGRRQHVGYWQHQPASAVTLLKLNKSFSIYWIKLQLFNAT